MGDWSAVVVVGVLVGFCGGEVEERWQIGCRHYVKVVVGSISLIWFIDSGVVEEGSELCFGMSILNLDDVFFIAKV